MKKSELRSGMRVVLENGNKYVVFEISFVSREERFMLANMNGKGWLSLSSYDDDMNYSEDEFVENYGVVEVYQPSFNNFFSTELGNLIWSKKSEKDLEIERLQNIIKVAQYKIEELTK